MGKTKNRQLTEQQKKFYQEYLIDFNATRAAKDAGYSPKTAHAQGCRLLKHAEGQLYLQKLIAKRAAKSEIKADHVLAEIGILAFSDMRKYLRFDEDTGEFLGINLGDLEAVDFRAIQEITTYTMKIKGSDDEEIIRTKLKLADKGANLDKLARHLGLYNDKLALTGKVGVITDPGAVAAQEAAKIKAELDAAESGKDG